MTAHGRPAADMTEIVLLLLLVVGVGASAWALGAAVEGRLFGGGRTKPAPPAADSDKAEPPVFTARQLRALDMIADDVTIAEIAKAVGVSRSTIYNWRGDPVFAAEEQRRAAARHQVYVRRSTALRRRSVP